MARRDITNYRTVTNVVADKSDLVIAAAADAGTQIIERSQEAKIIENMSAAQLELGKLANDYQIKYQGDPFNADGRREYQSQRQSILNKYGDSISPVFKRDWQLKASAISGQNEVQLESWAYKQAEVNTKVSIGKSMQNYLNQASIDGKSFGLSEATEIESFLNYASAKTELENYGNARIGETSTTQIINDFEQDWAKVFISGVAEVNPLKALKLMENDAVKNTFTNQEEYKTFRDAIKTRSTKINEVAQQKEITSALLNENSLLSQMVSRGQAVSYADLMQASQGMSESARNYLLKANGYKTEPNLKTEEKLQRKSEIYDKINRLVRKRDGGWFKDKEEISVEDLQDTQASIYDGMRVGALTQKEGADFLSTLLNPYIEQQEESMDDFNTGWFGPSGDFGDIQDYFEEHIEIKPSEGEEKTGDVSSSINATNKIRMYDLYYDALQRQAKAVRTESYPDGVRIGDIAKLPSDLKKRVYNDAYDETIKLFSSGTRNRNGIPMAAIQYLIDNPTTASQFDEMFGQGAANKVLGR